MADDGGLIFRVVLLLLLLLRGLDEFIGAIWFIDEEADKEDKLDGEVAETYALVIDELLDAIE